MAGIDRWIAHWADHRPDHPALWFEGSATSYRRLDGEVEAMAGLLAGREVGPGDRVAFCGLNRPELVIALAACARLGAVLLPLNNRLSPGEHRFQLEDATPALALVTDGFEAAIAAGEDCSVVNSPTVSAVRIRSITRSRG